MWGLREMRNLGEGLACGWPTARLGERASVPETLGMSPLVGRDVLGVVKQKFFNH